MGKGFPGWENQEEKAASLSYPASSDLWAPGNEDTSVGVTYLRDVRTLLRFDCPGKY